jgi:hypothetical protein
MTLRYSILHHHHLPISSYSSVIMRPSMALEASFSSSELRRDRP